MSSESSETTPPNPSGNPEPAPDAEVSGPLSGAEAAAAESDGSAPAPERHADLSAAAAESHPDPEPVPEATATPSSPSSSPLPAAPRWAVLGLSLYLVVLGAGLVTWHLDWPGLGTRGARLALDARALNAAHQWLPTLDPGAFYVWVQSLLFRWLGESTWAARLPTASGALALLIALLFAVRPSRPTAPGAPAARPARRPGGSFLAAAALLPFLPLWSIAARASSPLIAGGLWGGAALALLLGSNSRRGPSTLRGTLFFLGGVLAWLLGAGPVALLLPWVALALHLLLCGEWRALRHFANHRGAWVALLLLAVAHALMLYASPASVRAQAIEQLRHFASAWTQAPHLIWGEQLPWLGHLPLLLFLPAAITRVPRERIARLALIALGLALLLSLFTPLDPLLAALLALPASAQLAARTITARWGHAAPRRLPELWFLVAGLFAAAAVLLLAPAQLPLWLTRWWTGVDPDCRLVAAGGTALVALLLAAGLLLGRHALGAAAALTLVILGWAAFLLHAGADLDRALSHRPFLLELRAAPGASGPWVVLEPIDPSVAFYLGKEVTVAADSSELAAIAAVASRPINLIGAAGMSVAGGTQRRLETRNDAFVPPPWWRPQLAWWVVEPAPLSPPPSYGDIQIVPPFVPTDPGPIDSSGVPGVLSPDELAPQPEEAAPDSGSDFKAPPSSSRGILI
jgi:hypothetical protein